MATVFVLSVVVLFATGIAAAATARRRDVRSELEAWAARAKATPLPSGGYRVMQGETPIEITRSETGYRATARYALGRGPRYRAFYHRANGSELPPPVRAEELEAAVHDHYVLGGEIGIARRRLHDAIANAEPPASIHSPPSFAADGQTISVGSAVVDGDAGIAFAQRLAARLATDDLSHVRALIDALGASVVTSEIGLASIDVPGRVPLRITPRIAADGAVVVRMRADRVKERALAWRHPFDGPADAALDVIVSRADVAPALAHVAPDVRVVLDIDAMELVFPRFPTVAEARDGAALIDLLLTPAPAGPFR